MINLLCPFQNVLSSGVSGWMCDFGEALPLDAKISVGDSSAVHNQYPTLWAKLNDEVVQESAEKVSSELVVRK